MKRALLGALLLPALFAPREAQAIDLLDAVATSSISLRMVGQLFVSGGGKKLESESFERRFELDRARLKLSFRYAKLLRVDLEPDFAGGGLSPADLFLQVAPVRQLSIRAGRAKTPFGMLEEGGRWRLPSQRRGMVHKIVIDRMGFNMRRFGVTARVRLRSIPLRPAVDIGIYGEDGLDISQTGAARIALRLMKGLHVKLAGYTAEKAGADDQRGNVGNLFLIWERRWIYAGAELFVGRARLLAKSGLEPGIDANFLGVRLIASYRFDVGHQLQIEPYGVFELFEPNFDTRDDLSFAGRGGANLYWHEFLRVGFEADVQRGQLGAAVLNELRLTGFVGISLE